MVKKREIEEIRKFLGDEELTHESKSVSILYDGYQYFVKIPTKFARSIKIDKDKFNFTLELPRSFSDSPVLKAQLVQHEKKEIQQD